jgi:hypothetical protein
VSPNKVSPFCAYGFTIVTSFINDNQIVVIFRVLWRNIR